MTTLPIPINRYLVPPELPPLPDAFTRVRQILDRALPASIRLDDELSLALYVPTGDAILWRDLDGRAPILAAADEIAPRDAAATTDPAARPPVRLVLRCAGRNLGSAPLVTGLRRRLPDDGENGALVEIWIRDFQISAGTGTRRGGLRVVHRFRLATDRSRCAAVRVAAARSSRRRAVRGCDPVGSRCAIEYGGLVT